MRLVPTITSVSSMGNKTKFVSCLARQAALTAGLASAVTREISTNLLLDRVDPSTSLSFCQVLLAISPQEKLGTTLFHTIDRQFKSDIIVNFQFHPEYASEANILIAGLVPYLKDNGHAFHLRMFTPEALQRQARSRWNSETREVDSETDAELANLLPEDDDLNLTNKPTLEKTKVQEVEEATDPVSVQLPSVPLEHIPIMHPDDDSISTFHQGKTINLADKPDSEDEKDPQSNTSRTTAQSPVGILRTSRAQEDAVSKISLSDSATRISSLETELSTMNKQFHAEISKLQDQASQQAKEQLLHSSLLMEIITLLKSSNISSLENPSYNQHLSTTANHQATVDAGGPTGAAGHG